MPARRSSRGSNPGSRVGSSQAVVRASSPAGRRATVNVAISSRSSGHVQKAAAATSHQGPGHGQTARVATSRRSSGRGRTATGAGSDHAFAIAPPAAAISSPPIGRSPRANGATGARTMSGPGGATVASPRDARRSSRASRAGSSQAVVRASSPVVRHATANVAISSRSSGHAQKVAAATSRRGPGRGQTARVAISRPSSGHGPRAVVQAIDLPVASVPGHPRVGRARRSAEVPAAKGEVRAAVGIRDCAPCALPPESRSLCG